MDGKFLISQLLRPISLESGHLCNLPGGKAHRPRKAGWDISFFQNPLWFLEMREQGLKTREEMEQAIWDRSCQQQDEEGIVCFSTFYACDQCALTMATFHVNEPNSSAVALMTAHLTHTTLAFVVERETEVASFLGNLPYDVEFSEIPGILKDRKTLDLRSVFPRQGKEHGFS